MNKKIIPIIIIAVLLLILPFVYARESRDITGGLLGDIGKTIQELFSIELTIPHPGYTGDLGKERVMLWQVVVVFLLIYAIVWAASSYIKMFEKEGLRGARITFTVAVTLISIFGSPITEIIVGWITTLGSVAIILAVIVIIFFMVAFTKRGISDAGKIRAEAAQMGADNRKTIDEAKHAQDLLRRERRSARNMKNLEKKLKEECKNVKEQLETIKKMLQELLIVGSATEKGKDIRKNIADKIVGIIKAIDGEQHIIKRLEEYLSLSVNIDAQIQTCFDEYSKGIKKVETEIKAFPKGIIPKNKKYANLESAYKNLNESITNAKELQNSVSVELIKEIRQLLKTLIDASNNFAQGVNLIQNNLRTVMDQTGIQNSIAKIDELIAMDEQKMDIIDKSTIEAEKLWALVNKDQKAAAQVTNDIKNYGNACKRELGLK